MSIQLNHTIVAAHDQTATATFFSEILGLRAQPVFGPFVPIEADNDVTLDILQTDEAITSQHYAFLVSESEFDTIFGRIDGNGITYYADPAFREPGRINTNDGGRGLYFKDPNGHSLEIITRPYGSGE